MLRLSEIATVMVKDESTVYNSMVTCDFLSQIKAPINKDQKYRRLISTERR